MERTISNYVYKYAADARIQSGPCLYLNTFFFGMWSNYLYAVDTMTGKEKWKFETHKGDIKGIYAENGIVFCTASNFIFAISILTGKELWKFEGGRDFRATPSVEKGIVYIGCEDGRLYGIDIPSGQLVWEYTVGAPISSNLICNNLFFFWSKGYNHNGFIYVTAKDEGSLMILNSDNGQILAEFSNKTRVNLFKIKEFVIFTAFSIFYYYDTINQCIKWQMPMTQITGLTILNDNEVLIGTKNKILILNIITKVQKVIHTLIGYPSSPKIIDNKLYYMETGKIYEVDLETGLSHCKYNSNFTEHLGIEVVDDNLLFAFENNFYLVE